jgi:hypothetical protein
MKVFWTWTPSCAQLQDPHGCSCRPQTYLKSTNPSSWQGYRGFRVYPHFDTQNVWKFEGSTWNLITTFDLDHGSHISLSWMFRLQGNLQLRSPSKYTSERIMFAISEVDVVLQQHWSAGDIEPLSSTPHLPHVCSINLFPLLECLKQEWVAHDVLPDFAAISVQLAETCSFSLHAVFNLWGFRRGCKVEMFKANWLDYCSQESSQESIVLVN